MCRRAVLPRHVSVHARLTLSRCSDRCTKVRYLIELGRLGARPAIELPYACSALNSVDCALDKQVMDKMMQHKAGSPVFEVSPTLSLECAESCWPSLLLRATDSDSQPPDKMLLGLSNKRL